MKHVHQPLNVEIRSVGGYYKVLEEGVLDFDGRKALYVVMGAHVDTSCCGAGGVACISVPGFVTAWKSSTNEGDRPVSEVERIRDAGARKRLKAELQKKYPYITVIDFE